MTDTVKITIERQHLRLISVAKRLEVELLLRLKSVLGPEFSLRAEWVQPEQNKTVLNLIMNYARQESEGTLIPFNVGTQIIPLLEANERGIEVADTLPGLGKTTWELIIQGAWGKIAKDLIEEAKKQGLFKIEPGEPR